jgi:hypothetical protein
MLKKDCEMLQHEFVGGTVPKKLNGFYRGELIKIIPGTPLEHIGNILFHLWLPWKGKQFYHATASGDNVITQTALSLARWRLGKKGIIQNNSTEFHALPFRTTITKGLLDNIGVLQLDYNLKDNPHRVKSVIDELVSAGKNSYLGKAYIREKNVYRTVAFFRLFSTDK